MLQHNDTVTFSASCRILYLNIVVVLGESLDLSNPQKTGWGKSLKACECWWFLPDCFWKVVNVPLGRMFSDTCWSWQDWLPLSGQYKLPAFILHQTWEHFTHGKIQETGDISKAELIWWKWLWHGYGGLAFSLNFSSFSFTSLLSTDVLT